MWRHVPRTSSCVARAGAVVIVLGVLTLLGCKKKSSHGQLALPVAGSVSQVLKDFQMQDILEGAKNMVVEAPEGRILETKHVAEVDKPRVTFYKKGSTASVLTAPQGQ